MKHPTNKFERLQAERRRLERLYDQGVNDWYPCGVVFIVNDENCGKARYDLYNDCYGCKYRCRYDRDKGRYITWERPIGEPYTILKRYMPKHKYISRTTFYKRHSNRILRRKSNQAYKGNQYRKIFDYWWTLY